VYPIGNSKKISIYDPVNHNANVYELDALYMKFNKDPTVNLCFIDTNNLLICGGNGPRKDNVIFNIETKQLDVRQEMIYGHNWHGIISLENEVYVFGSYDGNRRASEVYKIDHNEWVALPEMPVEYGSIVS